LKIPKDYSEAVSRKTDHIMTKRKRTNNDPQNTTQETRLSNMNLTKTRGELMCFFRVSSYCSTSGTHRGTLVTNPVKNHEWRTGLWLRQTKHPWLFVTQIFTTVNQTNTYLVILATHVNSVSCWFVSHKISINFIK
jgi:hypothetical protein